MIQLGTGRESWAQSYGWGKCGSGPSAQATRRKKPSALNWVPRRQLRVLVPSSWNRFHMAWLETFPVGRAPVNGSFCFQQPCGEPSVLLQPGQASRPLSAYAPLYWPQMAVLTRIRKVHTMGPAVQFSSSVFLKPWIVWRSIVCVSVLWWAAAFNCHNRRRDDCTELTKANGIYSLPKPLQWQQIVFQVESSLWAFPNGPIRGEQRF